MTMHRDVAMSGPAIRTEALGRVLGTVRAVDDLTLEVRRGTVFGFLGPNGAGKTTTIRLLLGLLEPSDGRAEVLGLDTRTQADAIRARTGALLEHAGLYERMSAEDNLDFYGRIWRLPARARRARIQELLAPLGLWERRREIVGTWSRGMKQKLAVARALLHRPELVFMDEPTAGLDPIAAAALREQLTALVEAEGVTVFLTTHDLGEAEKVCHQVAVIHKGRLLAVGAPEDLRRRRGRASLQLVGRGFTDAVLSLLGSRPDVAGLERKDGGIRVALGEGADVAQMVALVVGAGAAVEEVRRDRLSLEDVFLTLMEEAR
jgi:ABC-2 type transport system ATP-binding protein